MKKKRFAKFIISILALAVSTSVSSYPSSSSFNAAKAPLAHYFPAQLHVATERVNMQRKKGLNFQRRRKNAAVVNIRTLQLSSFDKK